MRLFLKGIKYVYDETLYVARTRAAIILKNKLLKREAFKNLERGKTTWEGKALSEIEKRK